jgi:hypothetical protein
VLAGLEQAQRPEAVAPPLERAAPAGPELEEGPAVAAQGLVEPNRVENQI